MRQSESERKAVEDSSFQLQNGGDHRAARLGLISVKGSSRLRVSRMVIDQLVALRCDTLEDVSVDEPRSREQCFVDDPIEH